MRSCFMTFVWQNQNIVAIELLWSHNSDGGVVHFEKNLFGVENSTKHNNSNNSLVKDEGYSEIEKIQGKQEVMLRINPTQADQNLYLNLHYDCDNLYLFFQLQLS